MSEPLDAKIKSYAEHRQLQIGGKLGSGNQGTVFAALRRGDENEIAIKFHQERATYTREKEVYERLAFHEVTRVGDFNVPEMLYADDERLALEMTIVKRPFILDFGSARLDRRPEFDEEIWQQWLADKIEMFEERWPVVENIIHTFRIYGIHLVDVHPRNIAFGED